MDCFVHAAIESHSSSSNKAAGHDRILDPASNRIAKHRVIQQNSMMNFRDKIVTWDELPKWRASVRQSGRKLVVTNGCFDILHLGHVTYLEAARNQGDALLVGLNSDASVSGLKGPGRPVNNEGDRSAVLAALESVDGVCVFTDRKAANFLSRVEPEIYVKGGDYTLETLDQEERHVVERHAGRIVLIPFVPGRSTTGLLERIIKL